MLGLRQGGPVELVGEDAAQLGIGDGAGRRERGRRTPRQQPGVTIAQQLDDGPCDLPVACELAVQRARDQPCAAGIARAAGTVPSPSRVIR